ncbi:hypothetical protein DIS09_29980, partial [Burkholderia pseudomallei]
GGGWAGVGWGWTRAGGVRERSRADGWGTGARGRARQDVAAGEVRCPIGIPVSLEVRRGKWGCGFAEDEVGGCMTPLFISDAGFGTIIVMAYYVSNYNDIRNIPHPIYWI